MTGFVNPQMTEQLSQAGRLAIWPPDPIDLGPDGIQERVRRAHALRAAFIHGWLRERVANWRSLWRRPGRAIPKTYRPSKASV